MKTFSFAVLILCLLLFFSPSLAVYPPAHASRSADTYVVGWGSSDRAAAEVTPFDFTDVAEIYPSTTDHFIFRRKNGTFDDWQPRKGWLSLPKDAADAFMLLDHTNTTTVSVGNSAVLALQSDHTVRVIRANSNSVVRNLIDITDIGVGSGYSYARQADGDVFRWDGNYTPSTWSPVLTDTIDLDVRGSFAGAVLSTGIPVILSESPTVYDGCGLKEIPATATNLVSISIGDCSVIGVKANGTIVSWGLTAYRVPSGLTEIRSVEIGGCASIARKSDGTMLGWSEYSDFDCQIPANVTNPTAAFMGNCQAIALQSDGTMVTWGAYAPLTQELHGVRKISAQNGHYLALFKDNRVIGWGANTYGQSNIPLAVSNITDISAGGYHSLALKSDGTVLAWGANDAKQSTVPPINSTVAKISAGGRHSLALTTTGTVIAWGDNDSNQQPTLTQTLGQRIIDIDTNGDSTIVVRADGSLGVTQSPTSNHLQSPPTTANFTAAALGWLHGVALKNDGTLAGWGYNGGGQTIIPATLTDVVTIVAGNYSTLALTAHGQVVQIGYWENPPSGLSNVIAIELLANGDGDYAFAIIDPSFQTPTPSITPTPTMYRTATRTPTKTRTPTITRTPTRSKTKTRTPTITRTPTRSKTATKTITKSPTRTKTVTRTKKP